MAECSQRLIDIGFARGSASPSVFHHDEGGIRTLVHGDDYVSVGQPQQLKRLDEQLQKKYQIRTQMLGPGEEHLKEFKIFNRIVAWNGCRGSVYETDPRHVEIVVEQFGFKEAKAATTPGTKEESRTQADYGQTFDDEGASK